MFDEIQDVIVRGKAAEYLYSIGSDSNRGQL